MMTNLPLNHLISVARASNKSRFIPRFEPGDLRLQIIMAGKSFPLIAAGPGTCSLAFIPGYLAIEKIQMNHR